MSNQPTLVFIPGAWHKPSCYNKIIKILEDRYKLKCVSVTLPSTMNNPAATFKDDLDAARKVVEGETSQDLDVVVIAHSYGGMVGNSVIKGLAKPRDASAASTTGHVIGLILIASGCTLSGLSFMDPFFGVPPPGWRVNKETGYAELVQAPRDMFYHDVPEADAERAIAELATQSLGALFEGGEHSYPGWRDVPVWYVGTVEDRGLPVAVQRASIGMARAMGARIEHRELQTSHSPFLSQPEETVEIMVEAVEAFTGKLMVVAPESRALNNKIKRTDVKLFQPMTWYRFGVPRFLGFIVGRYFLAFGLGRRS